MPSLISTPITLIDTLPAGLFYVDGTLTATSGTTDDAGVPMLCRAGDLKDVSRLTLTYSATLIENDRRLFSNTAAINAGPSSFLNLIAIVIANGDSHYLPLVLNRAIQ